MPRTVEMLGQIIDEVPDDVSDGQLRAMLLSEQTQGVAREVTGGVVQGVSLGLLEGSEIEAAGMALIDSLTRGEDFSKAFTRNMQTLGQTKQEFSQGFPATAKRSEIAGTVAGAGGSIFALARGVAKLASRIGPKQVLKALADAKFPGAADGLKEIGRQVGRAKGAAKAAEKSKAAAAASKAANVPEAFRAPLRAVKTPKAAATLSDLKQGLSQAQKRDVDMFVRRLKSFDTRTRGLPPSRSMNAEELAQTKAFVDRLKSFPGNLNP